MSDAKQIYLVQYGNSIDYTHSINPESPKTVRPGQKVSGPQGDFVMSKKQADRINSLGRMVGATIELVEAHVKVSSLEVKVLAGPFVMRSEPSDDARYPLMTRSVVETPAGNIEWSNLRSSYILPDGTKAPCLSWGINAILATAK